MAIKYGYWAKLKPTAPKKITLIRSYLLLKGSRVLRQPYVIKHIIYNKSEVKIILTGVTHKGDIWWTENMKSQQKPENPQQIAPIIVDSVPAAALENFLSFILHAPSVFSMLENTKTKNNTTGNIIVSDCVNNNDGLC